MQANRAQQAAAFAAVNGNITRTNPTQLYYAKLASGHAGTRELSEVCQAAGVRIVRTNLVASAMKVGETQAIGALDRCLAQYGRDTLITALQCITQTADGNAGFVRATIIYALCQVIHTSAWRDKGDALLRAMDEFSFIDAWSALSEGRERLYPGTISKALADQLSSHLSDRLSNSRAKKSRPTVAIPVPHEQRDVINRH